MAVHILLNCLEMSELGRIKGHWYISLQNNYIYLHLRHTYTAKGEKATID